MAEYEKRVREILLLNGCYFVRHDKGDHDIYYGPITNRNFYCRFKDKITPYRQCHHEAKRYQSSFLILSLGGGNPSTGQRGFPALLQRQK